MAKVAIESSCPFIGSQHPRVKALQIHAGKPAGLCGIFPCGEADTSTRDKLFFLSGLWLTTGDQKCFKDLKINRIKFFISTASATALHFPSCLNVLVKTRAYFLECFSDASSSKGLISPRKEVSKKEETDGRRTDGNEVTFSRWYRRSGAD